MRRLGTLCLLFGLAAPAFAKDDPPAAEEPSIPWYRWLFLGERAKPKETPPERTAAKPATPAGMAPRVPPANAGKEALAKALEAERDAYLARLHAISEIRRVAAAQNDEAVLQRADELEAQADEVYNQRKAWLMAGAGKGDEDRAKLERGRDERPATADRTPPRRRTTGGNNR